MRPFLSLLVLFLIAGCGAPERRVFEPVEADTPRAIQEVLNRRVAGWRTVYAELDFIYEGPRFEGTFDVVFWHRAPGDLRMTAFKDLLLSSRQIFDLRFAGDRYRLVSRAGPDAEEVSSSGRLKEFVADHPTFAAFYWARDALWRPGFVRDEPTVERGEEAVRVETRLPTGAAVTWVTDPETLAVREGRVVAPTGEPFHLTYEAYRRVGDAFVPGRVLLRDPTADLRIEARLRAIEPNPRFSEAIFSLTEE